MIRGDVHWYAGPPTAVEKAKKRRPVLIISSNAANANLAYPYVSVAPITSNVSNIYPLEVDLGELLDRPSKVQPQNVFTCRKADLSLDPVLALPPEHVREVGERLKQYLELTE